MWYTNGVDIIRDLAVPIQSDGTALVSEDLSSNTTLFKDGAAVDTFDNLLYASITESPGASGRYHIALNTAHGSWPGQGQYAVVIVHADLDTPLQSGMYYVTDDIATIDLNAASADYQAASANYQAALAVAAIGALQDLSAVDAQASCAAAITAAGLATALANLVSAVSGLNDLSVTDMILALHVLSIGSYTYDSAGRCTGAVKTFEDGTQIRVTITYNTAGQYSAYVEVEEP